MDVKRKKIGIMGGTFDPIHYGHLLIAENAAQQYQLDEVLFMPTGNSPHKDKRNITPPEHRCEMVQLAIKGNPRFSLSSLEIDSQEKNYTYRTLEYLKQQEPEVDFYFIMGGDSLKDFSGWKYPQRILQAAYVLAAVRDDVDGEKFLQEIAALNQQYGLKRVFCLNSPNVSLSSRRIRQLLKTGKTVRYMLPDEVIAYIFEHHLYEVS